MDGYSESELNLIGDPSVSDWLKKQIKEMHDRDIIDMLNDCELLVVLVNERYQQVQSQMSYEFDYADKVEWR